MSKEDKNRFIHQVVDDFLDSMPVSDKKELIKELVPQMMNKMMDSLSPEDRKEVLESIMPVIAFQLAAKGGISMMMGGLKSSTNKKEKGEETPHDSDIHK